MVRGRIASWLKERLIFQSAIAPANGTNAAVNSRNVGTFRWQLAQPIICGFLDVVLSDPAKDLFLVATGAQKISFCPRYDNARKVAKCPLSSSYAPKRQNVEKAIGAAMSVFADWKSKREDIRKHKRAIATCGIVLRNTPTATGSVESMAWGGGWSDAQSTHTHTPLSALSRAL